MTLNWKNPLLERPRVTAVAETATPTEPKPDPTCRQCGFVKCICSETPWNTPLVPLPIVFQGQVRPQDTTIFVTQPQVPVIVRALRIKGLGCGLTNITVGCTSLLPCAGAVDVGLIDGQPVALLPELCRPGIDISLAVRNPSRVQLWVSACALVEPYDKPYLATLPTGRRKDQQR